MEIGNKGLMALIVCALVVGLGIGAAVLGQPNFIHLEQPERDGLEADCLSRLTIQQQGSDLDFAIAKTEATEKLNEVKADLAGCQENLKEYATMYYNFMLPLGKELNIIYADFNKLNSELNIQIDDFNKLNLDLNKTIEDLNH